MLRLISPVRFSHRLKMSLSNTQIAWQKALDALPATPDNIPAFFFSHGSPVLAVPASYTRSGSFGEMGRYMGPDGPLATFLKDFGPVLIKKYKPKGIVVFSAHWETRGERLVTDYGDENPLLMDYFGFPSDVYKLKFKSRGDSALARRVVELFNKAGDRARTTTKLEPRGDDGRGFEGPGIDHGVFVPFRIMFGSDFTEIPIVQVSIDSSLNPEKNWAIGKAVTELRKEGILVLSGGLTVHNLGDMSGFAPSTAKSAHHQFEEAVLRATEISNASERKTAMMALPLHPGFRASHPRAEHFIPVYIAGGAGEEGGSVVLAQAYGTLTVAFGL
ncbi:hypothetical protein AX15_002941 [Amanita polypyramis BW_CC]|nr:hypothetical protein AX15_002941 [Amanita polypyramis BW_CC]